MNKDKVLRILRYSFFAIVGILTLLFFLDVKFVVLWVNILEWDIVMAAIWVFVRLCQWAGRENTGRRTVAVIAVTLLGLFAAVIMFVGLEIPCYVEQTEPKTHRTFVVEYTQNMMNRGRAKLYERVGPLLFACDVEDFVGEFSLERPEDRQLYVSEDGKSIVVAYFFLRPTFIIPLEQPVETEKTPEQVLADQLIDDTHDAFLVDTGGKLGTLLMTAELEGTPTEDCDFTARFSVWDPASMDEPLQTLTAETNIFLEQSVVDANFDGYMDFTCTYLRGNSSYYKHLWIWNEEHLLFDRVYAYDEISVPDLDAETETIYGYNRSSAGGTGEHTFHQWSGRTLLCMRRIEIESADQPDTVRMSILDRVARELVEIYHEDFPAESGGWLDAQTAWHDLNYHGEPGGIYDIFQQQTIDNTHDAFLVDTRGSLGTLLITAELASENKNEFGARDITFTVWNPAEMEQPIQTFTEEFMMGVAPEFHNVVDANFDGFRDFGYLFHMGTQPNYWRYWLWDEEQAQFIYCPSLVHISQPRFDADKQVITGWARSSGGGDGTTTIHRWEDGELVCVRRIESYAPWGEAATVSVQDQIDGELKEVFYQEYSWEETSHESEWSQSWSKEESKWTDLDYHGEPTEEK